MREATKQERQGIMEYIRSVSEKVYTKDEEAITDEVFASKLIALSVMCAKNGTDNCDLELKTNKGVIKCHIEFETEDS